MAENTADIKFTVMLLPRGISQVHGFDLLDNEVYLYAIFAVIFLLILNEKTIHDDEESQQIDHYVVVRLSFSFLRFSFFTFF